MPIDRENPFVGPRPLETRDGIYGRDEEIRELLWFFTAERIVWLHSPSGAGKTSVVQAGLIPRLEADDFEVLPTIRVNGPVNTAGNRYEDSTLSCLNAESNLRDFLAGGTIDKSRVLIFDQFEEVLTLDSTDVEAKKAFFEAVGRALELPDIWALFVIREDFLPALDPYVSAIPTLMNHRFRLDLLTIDHACEAMEQIAAHGGRKFSPEASNVLGWELAKVLVQSAGGEVWKAGRLVEPVILQVVCRSMWEEMPADHTTIEPSHIPAGDKVTKALATYYANCVKSIADTPDQERTIRNWIGESLITSGIRNQVLDASENGAGFGASMAAALVKTHLIRREDRGDRTWYELAHDRLVDPIRADNQRWAEDNLHWVQRRADLWRLQDHPKAILLVDEDLEKATQWIKDSQPQLTPVEDEFLRQSREEQKVRNKIRRRTTLAWISAGVATTLLLLAMFLYLGARSRELINLALKEVRDDQLGCAVQDGVDALTLAEYLGSDQYRGGMEALSEALQGGHAAYEVSQNSLRLAFSPAASNLAVAGDDQVTIYRVPEPAIRYRWILAPGCTITRVSLSPDGNQIAFGLSNGAAPVQMVTGTGNTGEIECKLPAGSPSIEALAFSRTGALASAKSTGIEIDGRSISAFDAVALAFHPDGELLAAGLRDGTVRILNRNGNQTARFVHGNLPVTGVAWGRNALAAVSREDGAVRVWDGSGKVKRAEAHGHPFGIAGVALSPDGSLMATVGLGEDHQTKVWQVGSDKPPLILRTPNAKEAALSDVLFLDNTHLLAADSSGAVRLFPLDSKSIKERATDFLRDHSCERVR
jgi:hypothetical protein